MNAPTLVVRSIDAAVRPVKLRLPFRFGNITLQACPQLFVRVDAEVAGHGTATGFAAEMAVPKWFDKRPEFSHVDNVEHLLDSLRRTSDAYRADTPATAFGLFERHYAALMRLGHDHHATALSSAYGQALLDRAVIDALCRATGVSFFDAAHHNLLGIGDTACLSDLHGFDWNAWLRQLQPLRQVAARHTVGLLDTLGPAEYDGQGLPVSLAAVIKTYGHTHFKIKLGGEPEADAHRLADVLAVLDRDVPGHCYTLDGNEQYTSTESLRALFASLRGVKALVQRPQALLYVEQPLARDQSLGTALPWQDAPAPLLMDEADGTPDAFPAGFAAGWHGVSSKSCKGIYKALANRARCELWNQQARRDGTAPRAFMSAEDLTCQAGLSVQQDLALVSLLGLTHSERNGHHYGAGFGSAPEHEQRAFALAHPDLYGGEATAPRLRIEHGLLQLGSLFDIGFAHRADLDFEAMRPLADAIAML